MDLDNKYGTLEMQEALLVLLEEFDAFCLKENIKYSLSSGSLLGAVRHQGFIPWDDDLDCIMDRENVNKLRKAIVDHNKLRLESCTESALWIERVRLRDSENKGLYQPTLDVFIADNCPDNKIKAQVKLLAIKTLQGMMKYHLSLRKGSLIMKICSFVTYVMGLPFSHQRKYKWYNRVAQWGNNKTSKFVELYNDQWYAVGYKYPREAFVTVERRKFEDAEIYAFTNYHMYLSILYGPNYMTPPKEEDRKPIHMK